MLRVLKQLGCFVFAALGAPWILMAVMLLLGYPDLNRGANTLAAVTSRQTFAEIDSNLEYSVSLTPMILLSFAVIAVCSRGLRRLSAPKELARTVAGLLGIVTALSLIIFETVGFYMPVTWPTALLTVAGVLYVSVCQIANDDHDVTTSVLWRERRHFIR